MQKLTQIKLQRVTYIPRDPEHGILYVSEKYRAAVHLCACGCGAKVSTPLTPTEWALEDTNGKPSLVPSVGSWQLPCRSHYFIRNGDILWCGQWTETQIQLGRKAEQDRREAYFESRKPAKVSLFTRFVKWVMHLIKGS